MKSTDPISMAKKWLADRKALLRQVDTLKIEIEKVRARNSELLKAKAQAESRIESLRREKEALRAKAAAGKKAAQAAEATIEQLGAKITELREEIERLKNAERSRAKNRR